MKSSCRSIITESNHHSDQLLSIWSSIMIPRSPPFVTTPSSPSSAYARSPFSDLQNNVISVPLAANLADEGTSSSPSKAEVSLHKTSAKSHNTSSLTSGLDFEFDSCCLSEINDDPPVSPKLICPSATAYNYWRPGLHNNGRLEFIMQQINTLPSSTSPHITPVTSARHQPSAPSSPSVGRQLVEEKLSGDLKGYGFDYKSPSSAPQTTNLQQKQDGQLDRQLLAQDNSSVRGINIKDQTRSKSAVLERPALMELSPLMMQKQVYLAGRLENNSHLLSSSSSNGSSAMDINTSMDQAATSEIIKKHSSDSNKKWAFKDFLRRTVPSSSKGDRHHHNQSKDTNPDAESPSWQSTSSLISSSKNFQILSGLRKSAPMSPAASPPDHRSPAAAVAAKHGPAIPGHPSSMRSPRPRPPMSPHALHYRRKKARLEENKIKTFLPYRQSVLGCFGGAFISHSIAPR